MRDFDPAGEQIRRDAYRIDFDAATSAERAVVALVNKQDFVEAIFEDRVLTIVPIAFGETGGWMTPSDVRLYFQTPQPTDSRFRAIKASLDQFLTGGMRETRETEL